MACLKQAILKKLKLEQLGGCGRYTNISSGAYMISRVKFVQKNIERWIQICQCAVLK